MVIDTAHDSARCATPTRRRYSLRLAAKKRSPEEEKASLIPGEQRQTRNVKQHAGKKRSATAEEPELKRQRTRKNNTTRHAGKKRSLEEEKEPVLLEEARVPKRRRKNARASPLSSAPKKRKNQSATSVCEGEESEQPSNKRQRRTRDDTAISTSDDTATSTSSAKPAKNLAAAKTPKAEVTTQQKIEAPQLSVDCQQVKLPNTWTSKDERALKHYTGHGYKEVNKALRTGVIPAKQRKHIDTVNGALNKLSHSKGFHKAWTYRGTNLPEEIAETLQPGSTFVELAFMSTSSKEEKAFQDKDYFFMIKSKTGVDVRDHSSVEHEAEILFRPGTSFKVLTVFKFGPVTLVTMEEIVDDKEAKEEGGVAMHLCCLQAFAKHDAAKFLFLCTVGFTMWAVSLWALWHAASAVAPRL
jgi:hypothetical protein